MSTIDWRKRAEQAEAALQDTRAALADVSASARIEATKAADRVRAEWADERRAWDAELVGLEGGLWKRHKRPLIAAVVIAFVLGAIACFVVTRPAHATEQIAMPTGMVYAFCHPGTKTVMLDGPLFGAYVNLGIACTRQL